MNKILHLICMLLAVSMLTGCGKKAPEAPATASKSAGKTASMTQALPGMELMKTEIRGIVDSFYYAMLQYDWGTAGKYTTDRNYIPRTHWNWEYATTQFKKALLAENAALKPYIDRFEPFINCIFVKITEAMSYEIKDITINGSVAKCTVQTTEPPSNYEELIREALSGYSSSAGLSELTSDFLMGGSVTESEAMDALFDSLLEKVITAAESTTFTFEKKEHKLVLVPENNKWYIDTEQSEF